MVSAILVDLLVRIWYVRSFVCWRSPDDTLIESSRNRWEGWHDSCPGWDCVCGLMLARFLSGTEFADLIGYLVD